ncbi:MAG: 30S ribosomal protein S24e [Candidatus Diapherotrites archaeon]
MKVNIVSKQKNPLLHREEIEFEINKAKTTPSRKELREQIAALCNADSELVIIDDVRHSFGTDYVRGKSRVYESKEGLSKSELAYKVKRHSEKKKEVKEEPSKPKAGTEKKSEEKKEDAKPAEDKKEKKEDAKSGKKPEAKPEMK